MPRYFIDTDDEDILDVDDRGHDFPDDGAARRHALDALPEMARDHIPDGDHRTFVTTLRNAAGETIYEASLVLKGGWCRGKGA